VALAAKLIWKRLCRASLTCGSGDQHGTATIIMPRTADYLEVLNKAV
jgi:hypothetical protein